MPYKTGAVAKHISSFCGVSKNQEYTSIFKKSTTEDASNSENPSNEKSSEDDDSINAKEERTIFVGNLPNTIKKMKLKNWFSKYGTVESVRLRSAPLADTRTSKKLAVIKREFHENRTNINGYVRFKTRGEAENACSANGLLFGDSHYLRVDMANNAGKHDSKKGVFVGNLPFDTEEDMLVNTFKDCGDIESVRIVRDHATGVGKGFGYVNFKNEDSVQFALMMKDVKIKDRELRIKSIIGNMPPSKQVAVKEKKSVIQSTKPKNEKQSFQGIKAKKLKKEGKKKFKKTSNTLQKRKIKKMLVQSGSNKKST